MSEAGADRRPRVVIVGGGFGGLKAARALRRASVDVTVVDRANYHLFQPLLYQVATAALSPAHVAGAIRGILGGQRNTEVLMAEVTGVDTEARLVHTSAFSIRYDFLILAPGARYNYFGHPEWERYAPSLKTLDDALGIRQQILLAFEAAELETDPALRQALLTFVLVGGGPTGVEMAGSIAEMARKALTRDFRRVRPESARIILIEASDEILSMFPDHLSAAAQRALERLGVEVRLNCRVECVDAEGVVAGGERIASKTVLWTAGTIASPAGEWLKAETDRVGRVVVCPDLSVPGLPDVFVIGDSAHIEQDGQLLAGVSQVAIQGGTYVARLIMARVAGRPFDRPFRYRDKGILATIGRGFAIADLHRIKIGGFFAWLLWIFIHIWYLIEFRNRLAVMFQWAWAYVTYERIARLITAEVRPHTSYSGAIGNSQPESVTPESKERSNV